jgi:hypothetical protein
MPQSRNDFSDGHNTEGRRRNRGFLHIYYLHQMNLPIAYARKYRTPVSTDLEKVEVEAFMYEYSDYLSECKALGIARLFAVLVFGVLGLMGGTAGIASATVMPFIS